MGGFFRSNLVRALLVLLLGIVFLDGMSVFIKTLLPRYSALELSAYRNAIGMIPAIVLMLWSGELRTHPRRLMIPQWKLAFGRGLMVTVAQLFWYIALGGTEFALVAALGYTVRVVHHPQADRLRDLCEIDDPRIAFVPAANPHFVATFETPNGEVTF